LDRTQAQQIIWQQQLPSLRKFRDPCKAPVRRTQAKLDAVGLAEAAESSDGPDVDLCLACLLKISSANISSQMNCSHRTAVDLNAAPLVAEASSLATKVQVHEQSRIQSLLLIQ
jgi:hypothetical protein